MSFLKAIFGALLGSLFDGLRGWLKDRQSRTDAINAGRAEQALKAQAEAAQRREEVNKAGRAALEDKAPDMRDWN